MLLRTREGTTVVFRGTGGDVVWTPASLADGQGRISSRLDRGTGVQVSLYIARIQVSFASALTAGRVACEVYLVEGDGTIGDGNLSTTDATVTDSAKRNNLKRVGTLVSDSTTSGESQRTSFVFRAYSRYLQFLVWNASGVAFTSTESDHIIRLTPISEESL